MVVCKKMKKERGHRIVDAPPRHADHRAEASHGAAPSEAPGRCPLDSSNSTLPQTFALASNALCLASTCLLYCFTPLRSLRHRETWCRVHIKPSMELSTSRLRFIMHPSTLSSSVDLSHPYPRLSPNVCGQLICWTDFRKTASHWPHTRIINSLKTVQD